MVLVVRRAPPVGLDSIRLTDDEIRSARQRLALPDAFLLYPAQTWPHKNHLRLLEALALVRDRFGLRVDLVCSGTLTDHFELLTRRVQELRLGEQVKFLGYVSQSDLRVLYRTARFLIMPSLFEGYGFPIVEAFHEGLPVASSGVTSLPELVGDAGLIFDPTSLEGLADAIRTVWSDASLRANLVQRGYSRLHSFAQSSARTYRALYRRLAGRQLTTEDKELLMAAGAVLTRPVMR